MELLKEEILKFQKPKMAKNNKSREKEDQAEIEKFHDIVINFYNNKINKNRKISLKIQNIRNLYNSFLPSIKKERALNNNQRKSNNYFLL